MSRPLVVAGTFLAILGGIVVAALLLGPPTDPGHSPSASLAVPPAKAAEPPVPGTPAAGNVAGISSAVANLSNLLVIPNCQLQVIRKEEVPTLRDGRVLYVATEPTAAEMEALMPSAFDEALVSNDELDKRGFIRLNEKWAYVQLPDNTTDPAAVTLTLADGKTIKARRLSKDEPTDAMKLHIATVKRVLRKLEINEEVKEGQLLALVDPELAIRDFQVKRSKVVAAVADWEAAVKTVAEAKQRYETLVKLRGTGSGAATEEEARGAKLTWDRYVQEAIAKKAAITSAEHEVDQSLTVVLQHEIRADIPGTVHHIHRQRGESVKNLETIVQLQNHDRLRVEGRIEVQDLAKLPSDLTDTKGVTVVIEPTKRQSFRRIFPGHRGAIRGVAVSQKRQIVSASEDATVRVWDAKAGAVKVLPHPKAVQAVACSPRDFVDANNAPRNICMTGCADGYVRVYDLDRLDAPPVVFAEKHGQPINAVAFSPDNGAWGASAGDDNAVCLWDMKTGQLVQRFSRVHSGQITSVQFLSPTELVTASRDHSMALLTLDRNGSLVETRKFDKRSGDVGILGVHPAAKPGDTKLALFESGRELGVLDMTGARGELWATIQNPDGVNFGSFAVFSPDDDNDGKPSLVLTGCAGEGKVQLWRMPTGTHSRAYELRQLVWPNLPATCGAFSPMDSDKPEDRFIVTGTRDSQVLVWDLPSKDEVREQMTATLKLVGPSLEAAARELQIWAEIDNWKPKDGSRILRPGQTATMVVYPK